MKGWTADGREIVLTAFQETAVVTLLERPMTVVQRGRRNGWATCIATLHKLREDETARREWCEKYERRRGRRVRPVIEPAPSS